MNGGFFACAQNPKTFALEPAIGWCVTEGEFTLAESTADFYDSGSEEEEEESDGGECSEEESEESDDDDDDDDDEKGDGEQQEGKI